jgi:hypothetical protein
MFGLGTELIDVAIGLVLMYSVVSLVASAVVELLETMMRTRAKYLWQGIGELLDDPQTRGWLSQTAELLQKRAAALHESKKKQDQPKKDEHKQATPISVTTLYEHPLIAGLFYGDYFDASRRLVSRQLPSYIPKESFSTALIDLISREHPGDPHLSGVERLRRGVAALPASQLKQALQSIARVTGDDLTLVQKRIEAWYDTSMDSIASWYKRRAQVLLVVVGLVLAAIGNLDSWQIARRLAADKPRREAIAANAVEFVKAHQPDKLTLTGDDLKNVDDLVILNAGERTLTSPIGWLITALAVSLGAPFWFDLLSKFVTLRSSVKPKSATADGSDSAAGPPPGTTQPPAIFVRSAG